MGGLAAQGLLQAKSLPSREPGHKGKGSRHRSDNGQHMIKKFCILDDLAREPHSKCCYVELFKRKYERIIKIEKKRNDKKIE